MKKFAKAVVFATHAHKGQLRKGSNGPYVEHPIRVAERLRELNCPEAVLCAAVLHDVVEDTDAELFEVEMEFGTEVSILVDELTKTNETRKEYSSSFYSKHQWSRIIKMADRIDNLKEGGLDEGFTKRYWEESIVLFDVIKKAFDDDLYYSSIPKDRLEAFTALMDEFRKMCEKKEHKGF